MPISIKTMCRKCGGKIGKEKDIYSCVSCGEEYIPPSIKHKQIVELLPEIIEDLKVLGKEETKRKYNISERTLFCIKEKGNVLGKD